MLKKKNLVVGAGVSGAFIAQKLASEFKEDVLVIDKNPCLAGLCHDYKDRNNIVVQSFGTHVFHTENKELWDYLNSFTRFTPVVLKQKAFIDGVKTTVPFNLNSLHEVFPKKLATKLENKLVKKYGFGAKVPILDFKTKTFFWDRDFDFLASYVFQKTFKGQYEKKWGKDATEAQKSIIKNIFITLDKDTRYYKERYQGVPENGFSKLIENMLNCNNIKIMTSTDFKNIDTLSFDRIFYTGPIDEFFNFKYGALNYRSAYFDIQEINLPYFQSCAVVNYPNDFDFAKIHEFKHLKPENTIRTVIAKEYITDFKEGKNKRIYPVKDERNQQLFNLYRREARKLKNVYFIGRLGDFTQYSIDGAIQRAQSIFDSIKLDSKLENREVYARF